MAKAHLPKYCVIRFTHCKFCSLLTKQCTLIPVLEEVARLQVRLDDVNSFLFTHPLNKEPMVFYVPNKAVRNSLKLHVNVSGRAVCGVVLLCLQYLTMPRSTE